MDSTSRDYVWIDDIPVGVVDHNASVAVVNFIHADGLGSPRVVTDGAGVAQWKWPYISNPFGEHAPVSPSGYTLNLRFPGQYFDAESGLSYNINREYEAATGRYVQADPIGLAAGSNIYSYVSSTPLAASDSMGLQESPSVGPGDVLPGNYDSSTIGCDGMGGITVFIIPRSDCTDACDMRHELSHIKDALALNATVCSHQPIRTSLVFMPWSFLYDSEARAYAEGIKCLEEKLRAISDCDQCRAEIEKAINLYSDRLRRYAYAAKNP
jgi:RHS repeat-associated protein